MPRPRVAVRFIGELDNTRVMAGTGATARSCAGGSGSAGTECGRRYGAAVVSAAADSRSLAQRRLPVTSNVAVLAMFDSAAVSTSPIDASGGGIQIAFIGVVAGAHVEALERLAALFARTPPSVRAAGRPLTVARRR